MRKRIAIFGGSLFQDIKIENKKYITTKNQVSIKLSKNYDIENYSVQGLTAYRALHLIRSIPIKELYNDCIIALGENDLNHPLAFEGVLKEIINELLKNNVRPLLVSLPKEILSSEAAYMIQDAIDRVAVDMNIDYIYEGNTDKMVSYVVLDDEDMSNAILELC
ncbi:MAG: hypothetical protein K2I42_02025 [Anaeroplasmataceae bacterium]|nr:hypothetical protein [Anaeroplasmataceae bacterium]